MGQRGGKGVFLLALLVAVAVMLAGCGGDDGEGGSAYVNEDSGSTNGLPLDERKGTPPPPAEETDLRKAADKANCYLYLNQKDEGSEELPPDSPSPEYMSDVPTSGPHVEPPHQQADGAYMLTPEPIDFVASLDHGRMEIQYAPDLDEEAQLKLKGLYDTMYGGTLPFPNEFMNFAVAATTWRGLLGCTSWSDAITLDAIRAFGKETWGKRGSESVDAFPVSGPTPREPAEPDAS
jgi:hypothetical protein